MERPHFDIVASGARMRQIRRQRNISVKQVMEYMGFESMQAVYKWETGKCFPQADNLIALAMLYQVNPIELLVKEGDEMSSSAFYAKKLIPKELPFFYNNIAVLFLDAVRTTSENARLFEPSGEFRALKNKSGTSCIEK